MRRAIPYCAETVLYQWTIAKAIERGKVYSICVPRNKINVKTITTQFNIIKCLALFNPLSVFSASQPKKGSRLTKLRIFCEKIGTK